MTNSQKSIDQILNNYDQQLAKTPAKETGESSKTTISMLGAQFKIANSLVEYAKNVPSMLTIEAIMEEVLHDQVINEGKPRERRISWSLHREYFGMAVDAVGLLGALKKFLPKDITVNRQRMVSRFAKLVSTLCVALKNREENLIKDVAMGEMNEFLTANENMRNAIYGLIRLKNQKDNKSNPYASVQITFDLEKTENGVRIRPSAMYANAIKIEDGVPTAKRFENFTPFLPNPEWIDQPVKLLQPAEEEVEPVAVA